MPGCPVNNQAKGRRARWPRLPTRDACRDRRRSGLRPPARAQERIAQALNEAYDAGYLGANILSSGHRVELVESRASRKAAPQIASYVKNRMRENRILIGTEGPADNILKIRPPLTFDREGVDVTVGVLDSILGEIESRLG